MTLHNPPIACPEGARRRDELAPTHGEYLRPEYACEGWRRSDTDCDDEVVDPWPERRRDCKREYERRKREERIEKTRDAPVNTPPEIAGRQTENDPKDEGDHDRERPHFQRNAGAVDEPGEYVPPELVRTEQVLRGRRVKDRPRALASRPKILLLDEPTAGMNPAETLELAEQIKSLHALGLTILLIEHKLDVVTQLADTVVVLDHGDKIAEGRPEAVRRNEEVLRAYLGRAATQAAMQEAADAA